MPTLAMNQSAANSLLEQYGRVIDYALNSSEFYSTTNIIDYLNETKKQAEEAALNAFHLLGYAGNDLKAIEVEFNKRIQSLQQITFNLNGPDLAKSFLTSLSNSQKFNYNLEQEYAKFIQECKDVANQYTVQAINGSQDAFKAVAVQTLMPYINQVIAAQKAKDKDKGKKRERKTSSLNLKGINSSGMLYSTEGYRIGIFGDQLYKCGEMVREGFKKFLKANTNSHKFTFLTQGNNLQNQVTLNSTVNGDSLTMDFDFQGTNSLSFLKMTEKEREDFFSKYPDLQKEIVLAYKQEILSRCKVPAEYKDIFEGAIDRVVDGTKGGSFNALFGATGTNLTGVLGEIQALFYVMVITNENRGIGASEWVGGINNPHADLLISDPAAAAENIIKNYGIQVKNTASYLGAQKEIEFRSFNMSGWSDKNKKMNYLEKYNGFFRFQNTDEALKNFDEMGLPPDLSEAIQTLLLMKTFNVEYRWVDGEPKRRYNEVFAPTRKEIVHYAYLCQQVMVAFITSMMYMQVSNLSNQESNAIYIVAGTTAISAASIIEKIINEMETGLQSFQMSMRTSSSMSGNDNQYTIIDVIKGNKELSNLHFAFQSSYTFKR